MTLLVGFLFTTKIQIDLQKSTKASPYLLPYFGSRTNKTDFILTLFYEKKISIENVLISTKDLLFSSKMVFFLLCINFMSADTVLS